MTSRFSETVDPVLLNRAVAGDMEAHAELFRMFGGAVFALARRLVKRRDVAEEVLQETFLDVMRRIHGFRGDAPFGFWLRRIAVNRCLMFLRTCWEQHVDALDSEPADPATGFDSALQRVDLEALLDQLPMAGRTVLWLHDVEGYTHQEIGDLLGKTASFSKSQLVRSHARLRAMITNSQNEVTACSTPTQAS